MQAIETKYHGPTERRGSRISARCEAGRITLERDSALGIEENHRAAAVALLLKLGWHGHWTMGAVPGLPNGYVVVCYQRHLYEAVKLNGTDQERQELVRKWPTEGFDVWPDMVTS